MVELPPNHCLCRSLWCSQPVFSSPRKVGPEERESFLLQAVVSMTVPVFSLKERPNPMSWEELMFLEWLKICSTLQSMP